MIPFLLFLLSLSLSWLTGWLLVRALCPTWRGSGRLLRFATAYVVGMGISSWLYWLWLVLPGGDTALLAGLEGLTLSATGLAAFLRNRRAALEPAISIEQASAARWLLALGALAAVIGLGCAGYFFSINPHGAWDAWSIWNLHARFLFRDPEGWQTSLRTAGFFHADYPRLLPSLVARGWTYIGTDQPFVPALISICFAIATAFILLGTLGTLRGGSVAVLGLLLLLAPATTAYGNDSFVIQSAAQLADIPVGTYMLLTLALLVLHQRVASPGLVVLAGISAACAAWTKNEGLLFFVLVLALDLLRYGLLQRSLAGLLHRAALWSAGAAPGMLVVLSYKIWLSPDNDLVAPSHTSDSIQRLLSPERYAIVLANLGPWLLRFGSGALVALAIYALLAGRARREERNSQPLTMALAMLLGYIGIFLITPHDPEWHVQSAVHRLLLQIYPLAIMGVMLVTAAPSFFQTSASSTHPENIA